MEYHSAFKIHPLLEKENPFFRSIDNLVKKAKEEDHKIEIGILNCPNRRRVPAIFRLDSENNQLYFNCFTFINFNFFMGFNKETGFFMSEHLEHYLDQFTEQLQRKYHLDYRPKVEMKKYLYLWVS